MVKPRSIINISEKIDAIFAPIIKSIAKYGVTANHISLLQVPFVIIFFFTLIYGIPTYALIALVVSLFLDILDGAWARVTNNITKKGHFYDKVMDLFGIYAFLIGAAIGFPELMFVNIILGVCTALLYFTNEYVKPELYSGVRSFGLLGLLLGNLYLFLVMSAVLAVAMLLFKIIKVVTHRVKC
ncbi:MAG: CDP-alcohol phosphatidyltransferase family protein [Methanoregula sp.]|nr:CDP-alcohol phosphatidyltransferase family protein [Methanoregula sp.]